jgi:diacylglycerol kinase family enzyme
MNRQGWTVQLEKSLSGEHIAELAARAAARELDAVFIIGGDGSLNHAIAPLAETRTALGLLPAGTANVWAQEMGLPALNWARWAALEDAAGRLTTGAIHTVDVGWCNGSPFLLWAGVGLDGFVVYRIEPRSRWEKTFSVVHYGASALWYASQWRGLNMRVEVDDAVIEGHYLLVLASNIRLYAGGLIHLSPNNLLDDGVMEFWLIEGENMGDTIQRVWELFTSRDHLSSQIRRIHFRNLRLTANAPLYVQLDGEPLVFQGEVQIRVQPQALRVLVPKTMSNSGLHFLHPPLHPASARSEGHETTASE